MAALVSCPDEILCRIFQSITSISDLQNLMLSCRRFLHVIRNSNKLWRLKLTVVKNVRETLKKLSPLCYPMEDSPLVVMDKLIVGDSPMPEFVEEELLNQIFRQKTNENLTISFYAQKVLKYLRTKNLEKNWVSYNSQPIHKKSLLEGIAMISQWIQMEQECLVSLEEVECAIENIANRVRHLVNAKSNDSGVKTDVNDPKVARKIFAVMKDVLYKELQFSCVEIGEDSFSFQNLCVEKVLQVRCGISLVLLVVYQEIAKRMGVLCIPVLSLGRLLLQHIGSPPNFINCTFIDTSTGYYFPGFTEFFSSINEVLDEYVLTGMAKHFLEYLDSGCFDKDGIHVDRRRAHIFRLFCAIDDKEVSWITMYSEVCATLRIQLEETIQMLECKGLQDLAVMKICKQIFSTERANVSEILFYHRHPSMKYAVGLVMKYKGKEDFPHLGVINLSGMMRIDENGDIVPYFSVLFDGGQNCCWVPQDDLELLPGGAVIKNSKIGLHFERFDGRRYVLNATMNVQNPGNEEFVLSLLGFCDFARVMHNLHFKNKNSST